MPTRAEHNAKWNANRQPSEQVFCNTVGYGELSQYDADCPACWLGHAHTWTEHDESLAKCAALLARAAAPKPARAPTATCQHCGSILSAVTWTCVRGKHCPGSKAGANT